MNAREECQMVIECKEHNVVAENMSGIKQPQMGLGVQPRFFDFQLWFGNKQPIWRASTTKSVKCNAQSDLLTFTFIPCWRDTVKGRESIHELYT